jgi:hypothetical protein
MLYIFQVIYYLLLLLLLFISPSRNKRLNHGVKLFKPLVQQCLLSHSCYHGDEFTSTENSYTVYEDTCKIFFGLSHVDLCNTLCLLSLVFLIVFRVMQLCAC